MTDPIAAAKFLFDLAKSLVSGYSDIRKMSRDNAHALSTYLNGIASSLTELAHLTRNYDKVMGDYFGGDGDGGLYGQLLRHQRYLETTMYHLACEINEDEDHPAHAALEALRNVKFYDGDRAPELSALLARGSYNLPRERLLFMANEIERAAGEFKSAADLIFLRG